MEALEELRKWVTSLSIGEKRYIKVLGKSRAGSKGSQQLDLFDWLNQTPEGDTPPSEASFLPNLPTVIARLKALILDGLRLLHPSHDIDAELRTDLDHVALLLQKKLPSAAMRLLKRAKARAKETSRYTLALACLEMEHKILASTHTMIPENQLLALREEEDEVIACMQTLRELQRRHERLLRLVRHVSLPRDAATALEVQKLVTSEVLEPISQNGRYLERALAVNILGIKLCIERKPMEAIELYAKMLHDWQAHPAWLIDQASLLLTICIYFQSACFNSELGWDNARWYLQLVPDFKALAPQTARDYQRLLYHNRLTPALNTANFDSVQALIPEIDQWLLQEEAHLTEAQILPFLHNFAIATFLMGEHQRANRFLQRILQLPNRKIRTDIRDFALVLQAILQYEMGNFSLNEYLTRAGKRHFTKQRHSLAFEYAVFKYLESAMRMKAGESLLPALIALQQELDQLEAPNAEGLSILGLMEIRLWAQAKRAGLPIKTVFCNTIAAMQEGLE